MSMMMTPLRMSISCTTGFFSCLNRSGTQFSPLYIMSAQGELGNQLIKNSCHCILYCRVAEYPNGEEYYYHFIII